MIDRKVLKENEKRMKLRMDFSGADVNGESEKSTLERGLQVLRRGATVPHLVSYVLL